LNCVCGIETSLTSSDTGAGCCIAEAVAAGAGAATWALAGIASAVVASSNAKCLYFNIIEPPRGFGRILYPRKRGWQLPPVELLGAARAFGCIGRGTGEGLIATTAKEWT
jgi:hypothetical protein